MPKREIVVVGASAGGVEALMELVSSLPPGFDGTIFIVLHTSPHQPSLLPEILKREGPLPVTQPSRRMKWKKGTIYVAPPDHHMIIENGWVKLNQEPRVNLHRPAIDTLFRSAAEHHGQAVIGVVLTGHLDDGAVGLNVIKSRGGLTIVQDPGDAIASSMPEAAIAASKVDFVVPLSEIAALLTELTDYPGNSTQQARKKFEVPLLRIPKTAKGLKKRAGNPTLFKCPECDGALWELSQEGVFQFACYEGHVISPESLLAAKASEVEHAIWVAVRSLDERAALFEHLSKNMKLGPTKRTSIRRARQLSRSAALLRQLLPRHNRK